MPEKTPQVFISLGTRVYNLILGSKISKIEKSLKRKHHRKGYVSQK